MKPETWPRVRRLFEEALELEAGEREQYLAVETGGDREVLDEVRAMLAADEEEVLVPLVEQPGAVLVRRELVGTTIGGFEIVRQIGAGGMGVVYEARQQRPQRAVALKTLSVRFPSERARRRFEDEAEILARLRHPAIAQVLQAGTARADGAELPWFAMELVEEPRTIDRFVREEELDCKKVVVLFATVCDAVHYAHQRGVIHRDLKPANVLVDRHGQPKVIDFGIARLADGDAQAHFTRTGEILGTLAYMSPERLECADTGDATASDVYALGVILYELLCGSSPFPLDELPPARAMEVLRSGDPAPPSRSNAQVPVDLDWIVMKAMARAPGRRYGSVAELQQDLERFLRKEPVAAGPPSATYRLRRLAWRHRVLIGIAATLFVALTIGFVVALLGWYRVGAAERMATRKADVLREVNRFHEDVLGRAFGTEKGREIRLADAVDLVAKKLSERKFTDPLVEVGLRIAMGRSFNGLGRLQDAERELLRARALLAEHDVERETDWAIVVANDLCVAYGGMGKLDLAEREIRASLAARIAHYGAGHWDVAIGQSNLAAALLRRAAYPEALELATKAQHTLEKAHGRGSHDAIIALAVVAEALDGIGRTEEADRTLADVFALADQHLHQDHPVRLDVLNARAAFLHRHRRLPEFLQASEELAAVQERVNGPTHPKTVNALSNLAVAQGELGQHAAAEASMRRVLEAWHAQGVRDGYKYVASAQSLNHLVRRQGRVAEAEKMSRELRATAVRSLPANHWMIGVIDKELGGCLRELGRHEEAETLLLPAHALLERTVGASDHRTQKVVIELIALYEALPRPADLESWRAKQVKVRE